MDSTTREIEDAFQMGITGEPIMEYPLWSTHNPFENYPDPDIDIRYGKEQLQGWADIINASQSLQVSLLVLCFMCLLIMWNK